MTRFLFTHPDDLTLPFPALPAMLHRLLYPWNLPPYGLPNPGAFEWQPANLADECLLLPAQAQRAVQRIEWERMFDFSCKVAHHLRRLGVRFAESVVPRSAVLIASNQQTVPPTASAHAFLMSLAQRAAIDMAGLMTPESQPATAGVPSEICGVAFLAETCRRSEASQRLAETLRRVAHQTTDSCSVGRSSRPSFQFSHSRPAEIRSPIPGGGMMPVAGYRIRFAGCGTASVLQALADALHHLPVAPQMRGKADILVLSNLWTPTAA